MVKEGSQMEQGYYFPGEEIEKYLQSLPDSDFNEDILVDYSWERVVVMTHDDIFDPMMAEIEHDNGYRSTWFIDMTSPENNGAVPDVPDIGIHFNKSGDLFGDQIKRFKKQFGHYPRTNRNHRLLIRSANLDFPFLAMNGIKADSTLIGTRPYFPVISGKVLPILELPFCISDRHTRTMSLYNVAKSIEQPFKNYQSVIVVLAHPYGICKHHALISCYDEVVKMAEKYGYPIIGINDLLRRNRK